MSTSVSLVYVTAPNQAEALRLAHAAVEEGLAACANVLGPMTSVYRWEGKLHEDGEVPLLLKTRTALIDALVERIRALHPYDCPCVASWPISGGNPEFLEWIASETRRDPPFIV